MLYKRGLVVLSTLVILVLGLQLGQAFGGTISATYLGEIPTGVEPIRIAVDSATHNIFVSSPSSGSVLEYNQSGALVSEITGFDTPLSVAVDGSGRLFVGDSGDGRVSFYDLNGGSFQYVGELGAGAGEFGYPGDIAVSQNGNVYVTDSVNNIVKVYNASTGAYVSSIGSFGAGSGQFNFPAGIACDDTTQQIYVVDQINGRIQVFNLTGTYIRSIGSFGSGNGKLTRPQGVFVMDGYIYVTDSYQSTVEVFTSTGAFVTFIGSYGSGAGLLRIPMDVALDGPTMYVTNSDNLRIEAFDISYFSSISGSVTSAGGAAIQDVLVTLTGPATLSATTDSIGHYSINNAPDGSYTLTASAAGFTFTGPLSVVISGTDLTSQNFSASSYTVSGGVATSSGVNLSGVVLTLSGTTSNGASVSKTTSPTNSTGAYIFSDILPGSYTVTPARAGYTFTPANVTVTSANVIQNFVAPVYTISGYATTGSNAGISGVTMTITIGTTTKTATTATNGSYSIVDVPSGSYTVTPSKSGYVFTPANRSVTVGSANVIGVNFKSFSISGTVKTSNNVAITGVLMTLSGGGMTTNKTTSSNSSGIYTITGLGDGTYTLTPTKAGYAFTPVSVTVSGADVTENFVVPVYSIGGSVTTGSLTGISGVTMSISIGGSSKTATTATDGSYTINDVPPGNYVVTPSKAGYCFTPASQSDVIIDAAGVTGVNFKSFTISGTVKTSNNVAITGVLVTLSGGGLTTNKTSTTTTSGEFTFPGLCNGTYTLTPTKVGYSFLPVTVIVNGNDVIVPISLQSYSISGFATSGSGVGISSVTMSITIGTTSKTATTATNGSYTITGVPPGTYTVTATKAAYVFTPASQAVTVTDAAATGVNFNSFTLSGTVKTSTNVAISGVRMTLSGGGLTTNKIATTTATGAYSIAGLGNGTYTLTPTKTGYTFTPVSVTVSGADAVVNVGSQVYSISGSVTTGGGVGISGVSVKTMIGTTTKTVTTATNGSYILSDLPPGNYTVTATKTAYVFTPASQVVTVAGTNVTGVNIKSFTLSGYVKTLNNVAISGVLMTLSGGGMTANKAVTTSTSGAYTISGLGNGAYTLTPTKPGYTFEPISVTVSDADVVQNIGMQGYSISGSATTGAGAGISGVIMTITIGTTNKTATTAADGSYTITDVPSGSYTVTPSKAGYVFAPVSQAVTIASADVTGVNFNSFTLSGTVKTSNNVAISGVLMTLSGGGLTTNKTATTSTSGTYSIAGLGNGTYTLTPTKTGYSFEPVSVTINNADLTQDFTDQVFSISGSVTTGGGVGISSATMTITIGTTSKTTTTATDGSYTITDVPVGDYTVTPSKSGYCFTPASHAVTVAAANVTGVDFKSFNLTGTVSTSTGTVMSGVAVTLSGGGLTANKTSTTTTTGAYTFVGLCNGTYTVTLVKAGYTFAPHTVIINNDDVIQDVSVQVYSISGSVTTGGGTGISSATMTISIGGTNKTATTSASGSYTIADVPPGNYTISAGKAGYVFTPASQAVTVDVAAVTGVNFNSFTVSGTVKTSSDVSLTGVLMTLSGGGLTSNKTATTTTTGTYTISGLGNGTYTLTPTKAGYTFTPASVTVSGADATENFTVQVYSISGSVTTGSGSGVTSVTVKISIGGTNKTATTTTSGSYTINDVPVGNYTVTPTRTGYVFTPPSRDVTVDTANITGVDFNSFALTGTVKTSGNIAISSVVMTLSGGGLTTNKTATTTTTGTYTISGLGIGTYTLTPSKAGYTFTPASKVVTISDADFAQNFTGALAGTTPESVIAAAKGPDAANDAVVRLIDLSGGLVSEFQTLSTSYGARVAMGDLLGDGSYEVIVAPGNGSTNQAQLKVYNYIGTTLSSLVSIANTVYGASVVAGDINGDGKDEVVMSSLSSDMLTHTIGIYGAGIDYSLTQIGGFSFMNGAPVTAPANIAVGELDGAGNLELIISFMTGDGSTNTVNVYTLDALMNQTLSASGSYPLGSTVSALNLGGGATEDIALGYTDGTDSLVRFMDASLVDVSGPMTAFAGGGSAPTLSAMDIDGDGEMDLLTGMGDQAANPALLKTFPSGSGTPADITVFESLRGVNADFGILIK
ncbi:MAG: carboxypeptidase regulatory-like domain-containing protein [Nitrospirae bacterium]|nr:carboxypeptidase regulatory-like domain-containing protein [Nitrospirota bacterium]